MAEYFANLSPESACDALRAAGLRCTPEQLYITARDERWAVALPADHIAWFPASESGSRRLAVERRVPSLLRDRCSFQAPRIVVVSDLGFDIRQMVPGQCDPWALFQRCQTDPALTRQIGRSIGGILAEQHTAVSEAEITGWLPERVAWPESGDWIRRRLPSVVDDSDLLEQIDRVIDSYGAVTVSGMDRTLIHGDVGLHNLALDPKTNVVNGIFDYDSAAWADRHHDFRYLLFDVEREDMLGSALDVYEPLVGRSIDRGRVRLYNAACAISYLAFRLGTPPQAKSCGRTLAEDLRWVRTALTKCEMPSRSGSTRDAGGAGSHR